MLGYLSTIVKLEGLLDHEAASVLDTGLKNDVCFCSLSRSITTDTRFEQIGQLAGQVKSIVLDHKHSAFSTMSQEGFAALASEVSRVLVEI